MRLHVLQGLHRAASGCLSVNAGGQHIGEPKRETATADSSKNRHIGRFPRYRPMPIQVKICNINPISASQYGGKHESADANSSKNQ